MSTSDASSQFVMQVPAAPRADSVVQHKAFELTTLKMLDDEQPGKFTGIASAAGVLDMHGEVIERGAFTETLARKGNTTPLLWQHNMSQPIGVITLSVDEKGDLVGDGELNLETQLGREAYALLKQGAIHAMSIGFNIPTDGASWDADHGVMRIHKIDLWEVSLVTFPANPAAQVFDVKQLAEHVKAGRVLSAKNKQLVTAARDALDALLEAAGGVDETDSSDAVGHPIRESELADWKQLIHSIRGV